VGILAEVGNLNAKLGLDTAEFRQGIKTISQQMSIAREEFKQATSGLDKVADAMKIAEAKAKMLSSQIQSQRLIVQQFRQAHAEAVTTFGEGSKQATNYELSLKKSETTLKRLETQLQSTNAQLNASGMTASQAAEKFRALGITFESVGAKFQQVGRALSIAITAPLIAGATAGLAFSKGMEESTMSFTTMLGSADKAKQMVADLTQFAKVTPFEVVGLNAAATTLLNFGVNARDVMPDIKMLGDVSLGNQEKFDRLAYAFGQISAKGRLTGDELKQLVNAGFNPLQTISEKTGESMMSLKDRMEAGNISFAEMSGAFKIATSEGGRFYKAMENASKTFGGQLSTLKDAVNITLGEVMKPLFDDLSKNVMPRLIDGVEKLGKAFNSLSDSNKLLILKAAAVVAILGPMLIGIGAIIAIIPSFVAGIQALGVAFTFLAANPIILGIAAIAAGIGLIVYAAGSASREIAKMTDALIEGYKKQGEAQKAAIDKNHKVRIDAIDRQIVAEETAFNSKRDLLQKEYEAEVKNASKIEQAMKKSLQERKSLLDENHKNAIDKIRDEYGVFEDKSKTKTEIVKQFAEDSKKALDDELSKAKETSKSEIEAYKSSYEKIIEKAEKSKDDRIKLLETAKDNADKIIESESRSYEKYYDLILKDAEDTHNQKIKFLDEEYLRNIEIIDENLANKIIGLNSEIDGINAKTDEEEKILKDQANAEKIIELQKNIDAAKTDDERLKATKDLAYEINKINRDKEIDNRKIQIESLKLQITKAKESATTEKEELKKKLADNKIKLDTELEEKKVRFKTELDKFKLNQKLKSENLDINLKKEKEKLDIALVEEKARLKADLEEFSKKQDDKLIMIQRRIENEKIEIDKKSKHEVEQIQKERLSKEEEENKKYKSAKKALDNEETALDEWLPKYKEKLEAQLSEKQKIEKAKYDAVMARLKDELAAQEKQATAEKSKIDEQTRIKTATAQIKVLEQEWARMKALRDYGSVEEFSDYIMSGGQFKINSLNEKIIEERARLHNLKIPGFATGVTDWRGGLARVNEQGGEIINLPGGSNVIPHDISMQIANAIGQGSGRGISLTIINQGTLVGSNGMSEFADTISQKISGKLGLSLGGAF
jgi:tape measure domain-containing protein